MPRPGTAQSVSPFQELLRRDLQALDPPVDLDAFVIGKRQAGASWREISDEINRLAGLDPPVGHSTLRHWYNARVPASAVMSPAAIPLGDVADGR